LDERIRGTGVTERSVAAEIDGDLDRAGKDLSIVTSGKISGSTKGEGVSPTSPADGDDREDGGVSSGVAVELRGRDSEVN
jgi:hypothetical protein